MHLASAQCPRSLNYNKPVHGSMHLLALRSTYKPACNKYHCLCLNFGQSQCHACFQHRSCRSSVTCLGSMPCSIFDTGFWLITLQVVESFYGQDLDSGHHGSGFPLPPFRQRLLEEHLQKQAAARGSKAASKTDSDTADDNSKRMYTQEETVYSEHSWNINNLPRCKVSFSLQNYCHKMSA